MATAVLFVGDIHLGRSPGRLASAGLDPARIGPAEALRRMVQAARSHEVQAVVLAGDVVDQDKDRFEALAHLSRGVEELLEAGIRVLGVAGNHDHIALPRLADRLPDFHLLGAGGRWECVHLNGVDLLGWSFPSRHHRTNPTKAAGLNEALAKRRSGRRALGVLHADLDQTSSLYAPVQRADLQDIDLDGWFLGHIHTPQLSGAGRPLGYLGSLVGLDRSESGRRGPWLVEPEGASLTLQQLPLGPVHWLDLEVDVTGLPVEDDVADALHNEIEAALTRAWSAESWLQDGDFSAVGASVTFVGRTPVRHGVARFIDDRKLSDLVFSVGGNPYVVVHLSNQTLPAVDLDALARQRTPLGRLACLVRDLEQGATPPIAVRDRLEAFDDGAWRVDSERHPAPSTNASVRAGALRLLDRLLEQSPSSEVR